LEASFVVVYAIGFGAGVLCILVAGLEFRFYRWLYRSARRLALRLDV
jgi:hypothetical protein